MSRRTSRDIEELGAEILLILRGQIRPPWWHRRLLLTALEKLLKTQILLRQLLKLLLLLAELSLQCLIAPYRSLGNVLLAARIRWSRSCWRRRLKRQLRLLGIRRRRRGGFRGAGLSCRRLRGR